MVLIAGTDAPILVGLRVARYIDISEVVIVVLNTVVHEDRLRRTILEL